MFRFSCFSNICIPLQAMTIFYFCFKNFHRKLIYKEWILNKLFMAALKLKRTSFWQFSKVILYRKALRLEFLFFSRKTWNREKIVRMSFLTGFRLFKIWNNHFLSDRHTKSFLSINCKKLCTILLYTLKKQD